MVLTHLFLQQWKYFGHKSLASCSGVNIKGYCVRTLYVNLVVFPNKNLFAAIQGYRTFSFVFSQRFSPFTPIIPCADWGSMCSCKLSQLCFSACISVRNFVHLILVFTGRCRCSEWQKTRTVWSLFLFLLVFIMLFASCHYKIHFVISVT